MASVNLSELIVALEHQTWKALQSSGSALLPFLSGDCIMFLPMGMKISASTVPSLKDIMTSEAFVPWTSYDMSDVAVTALGQDAAVVSYRVRATRGVDDAARSPASAFTALISSIWRRDSVSGGWLMVFHQQTPFDVEV